MTSRTVVTRLPKGSPSQGKLQKGDVIVSVDGTKVVGSASLRDARRRATRRGTR